MKPPYAALNALFRNNPNIGSFALTVSNLECNAQYDEEGEETIYEDDYDRFTLDVHANVTNVTLSLKHAAMLQLLPHMTLPGVETLDVRILRSQFDRGFDLLEVGKPITLVNAPRLRHFALHMGGPRQLLLHGVVLPIANSELTELESVTVDFDLVELSMHLEWKDAVRRIIGVAKRGVRWTFRVRENEVSISELIVVQ